MKESIFSKFPSKLLLFGEYLVIQGYEALATPITNYSGKLKLADEENEQNIAPFIQYLGALPNIILDQNLIEELPLEKLIFDSNIPIGYGAGSSGALTAAVYDAFVLNKKKDLKDLKEDLATMEDFFHGSSSGIDPLISYSKKIILNDDSNLHFIEKNSKIEESIRHFFLVDTGIQRKTEPLVNIFKSKIEDASFQQLCANELSVYNRNAIENFKSNHLIELSKAIAQISNFQFMHFKEMIPPPFVSLWQKSLLLEKLSIKLCGAGGGGFLLIFAEDIHYAKEWFSAQHIELIEIQL